MKWCLQHHSNLTSHVAFSALDTEEGGEEVGEKEGTENNARYFWLFPSGCFLLGVCFWVFPSGCFLLGVCFWVFLSECFLYVKVLSEGITPHYLNWNNLTCRVLLCFNCTLQWHLICFSVQYFVCGSNPCQLSNVCGSYTASIAPCSDTCFCVQYFVCRDLSSFVMFTGLKLFQWLLVTTPPFLCVQYFTHRSVCSFLVFPSLVDGCVCLASLSLSRFQNAPVSVSFPKRPSLKWRFCWHPSRPLNRRQQFHWDLGFLLVCSLHFQVASEKPRALKLLKTILSLFGNQWSSLRSCFACSNGAISLQ